MRRMLIALAALLVATLGLPAATSAATLHPGDILVAGASGSAGTIIQVDPATGIQTLIASGHGLEDPWGLAVGSDGRIFVADDSALGVFTVDPSTGAVTPFSIALARSFNGPLVVAEQDEPAPSGAVITVDPSTGVQTRLASGGELHSPDGVTVVPPVCFGRYASIVGGPTPDVLIGTPGPDVIASVNGKDKVNGLAGNDLICGGNGKDKLRGGAGRDKIKGENGADKLIGGKGKDVLRGGKGRDVQAQ